MNWVQIAAVVWPVLVLLGALVIGRLLQTVDRRDEARRDEARRAADTTTLSQPPRHDHAQPLRAEKDAAVAAPGRRGAR